MQLPSFNPLAATTADITVRPLSTWIGGATGNWSLASNWDALPDLSNVLAVTVPTGKSVTYDAAAGSTNLASLTAAGLSIAGGSLNIANSLTVSSSFSQTGGTLGDFGGGSSASITQASGNLNLPAITVANLSLNAPAGAITQSGRLAALTLNTQSQGATTLNNPDNQVSNRVDMTAGGPLILWASGDLILGAINAGANPVEIKAGGAILKATGTETSTNIIAGSADLASIFGGAAGDLAISTDTQITGALTATVGADADFGGIRIKNTGAQPASVTLTDNALAGAGVSFLNTGNITSTSGFTLKTLTGGDLALLSNGNITWDGGSLITPSGSVLMSADGSLAVTGALSSPVDLALSSTIAINVSGSVITSWDGHGSLYRAERSHQRLGQRGRRCRHHRRHDQSWRRIPHRRGPRRRSSRPEISWPRTQPLRQATTSRPRSRVTCTSTVPALLRAMTSSSTCWARPRRSISMMWQGCRDRSCGRRRPAPFILISRRVPPPTVWWSMA